jgi:N-acetylmuramoyl-L-alanine amidase
MIMKCVENIYRIGCFLLCIASGTAAGAAVPVVTDARLGTHPGQTRLVLEVSQPVSYKIFTLANPYRVVVDFPALQWKVTRSDRRLSLGVVSSYRYGLFQAGVSRLVIDVKKPVQIARHQILRPASGRGHRFLIDLTAVGEADFKKAKKVFRTKDWRPPTKPVAIRRPPPPPRPSRKGRPPVVKRIIMLDPGHGGPDPGAIGVRGLREKIVTLRAANAVRRLLESTGRYRVYMTRHRDTYVPLRKRYQKAQKVRAELFISIHADSHKNRSIRGASVYTLSEKSSDREAGALAARENRSDIIAGIDLSSQSDTVASILIGLRQRQTMNESAIFGEILIRELARDIRVLRNTHRFAGFAVLKSPDTPSVLMELGYLSSPSDEGMFRKSAFYQKLAKSIYRTIEKYFKRRAHLSRS